MQKSIWESCGVEWIELARKFYRINKSFTLRAPGLFRILKRDNKAEFDIHSIFDAVPPEKDLWWLPPIFEAKFLEGVNAHIHYAI
jgi:hypothetical protein